jgi:hypothetical protein
MWSSKRLNESSRKEKINKQQDLVMRCTTLFHEEKMLNAPDVLPF